MPSLPDGPKYPVVFARSLGEGAVGLQSRPGIVVAPPSPSSWNDFGHYLWATLHVLDEHGSAETEEIRFMFSGGGFTGTRILQMLADRAWISANDVDILYCSLLRSTDAYRNLVDRLGFENAVSILRAIGDVVLLRLEGGDDPRVSLLDSEPFHYGMLRQEDAYTTFRRGGRFLRAVQPQQIADAATSFTLVARLTIAPNPYVLEFDFDPDPLGRDRLCVLIGRNGVGKSQLLLALLDGLRGSSIAELTAILNGRPKFLTRNDAGRWRISAPKVTRALMFSSTNGDAYPRQLPPWSGLDYEYFSLIGGSGDAFDPLTVSLVDCLRDDLRNTFPIRRPANDVAAIFGTAQGRMDLLKHVLGPIGVWESVHVPLKPSDDPNLPELISWEGRLYFPLGHRLNEGRRLRLTQLIDQKLPPLVFNPAERPRRLSSGEMVMFRFAAQAAAAIETGSLVLFDEPETHLHPNFISDFAEILHLLLVATKSVAIIATHSAYLVRETPSRRVRVLAFEDEDITITEPRLQTFGSSIDSISQAVFQDSSRTHQYQSTLGAWLEGLPADVTVDHVIDEWGRQLNPETLSLIARVLDRRNRESGHG